MADFWNGNATQKAGKNFELGKHPIESQNFEIRERESNFWLSHHLCLLITLLSFTDSFTFVRVEKSKVFLPSWTPIFWAPSHSFMGPPGILTPQKPGKLAKAWRSLGPTCLFLTHFSLEEATALGFTDLLRIMGRGDGGIGSVLSVALVISGQVHVGGAPVNLYTGMSIVRQASAHYIDTRGLAFTPCRSALAILPSVMSSSVSW